MFFFFFSSRRRHTRSDRDWSSDVCSSDLTGDSGNGMTHGTIAGMLIVDLIAGRENPWTKLYDPARKTLKPAVIADYIAENTNVAAQLRDYVTPGDEPSADKIKNG